jgi:hypothetical protein
MAQQTDHIGDTNKMVEHHIVDTNKMITAVEWFMERIGERQHNGMYVIDTLEDVQNLFEQAKAMEKEQIINAFDNGIIAYNNQHRITDDIDNDSEQYYNETYSK